MKTIKELKEDSSWSKQHEGYLKALKDVLGLIKGMKPTMAINDREKQIVELVKEELKARIEG